MYSKENSLPTNLSLFKQKLKTPPSSLEKMITLVLENWTREYCDMYRNYPMDLIKLIVTYGNEQRLSFHHCKSFGQKMMYSFPGGDTCVLQNELLHEGYGCIVLNEEYSVTSGVHTWRIQTQKDVFNTQVRTFWLTLGIGIVGQEYTHEYYSNTGQWSISNWGQVYNNGGVSNNNWLQWDSWNHFVIDLQLDIEKNTIQFACVNYPKNYLNEKNGGRRTHEEIKEIYAMTQCSFPANSKLIPRFVLPGEEGGMIQIAKIDNSLFGIKSADSWFFTNLFTDLVTFEH
ncbi:hypothetical protein RFI_10012 [Reticulomyxa filosa]|uniref:B30.2/SPRY domain-containing protein n=1 Tax=Reticulomyxa filosa TaxID=46433 RepID=X6NM76_RETFI|nr:hypothetical protein RFI_10012 [Reticulomyxa filosa]|eukprot:ETO27116.1 hypothetical protein RFI_10012 [Reticulomyxa filosa]